MDLPNIYAGDYRKLILIPIALILISLYFIPQIPQGIELKGGILITLQANGSVDSTAIQSALSKAGVHDATVLTYSNPLGTSVEVEVAQNPDLASAERDFKSFLSKYDETIALEFQVTSLETAAAQGNATQAQQQLPEYRDRLARAKSELTTIGDAVLSSCGNILGPTPLPASPSTKDYHDLVDSSFSRAKEAYRATLLNAISSSVSYSSFSFQDVSPSLSEFFISKAVSVVIFSAILSAIVVFIVFREFIPSVAVLTGATSDVLIAMGAMGLFGIPLTLSSFAALLMLIGFSLDTDVLLTMRVLKRTEGTAKERAFETMKTGITMSSAALVAFACLFILSLLTHIPTYYQISAVAIAGLVGDLIATWFFNGVIILWYLDRKRVK